jgi:hypothetical protein
MFLGQAPRGKTSFAEMAEVSRVSAAAGHACRIEVGGGLSSLPDPVANVHFDAFDIFF